MFLDITVAAKLGSRTAQFSKYAFDLKERLEQLAAISQQGDKERLSKLAIETNREIVNRCSSAVDTAVETMEFLHRLENSQ